MAGARAPQRHHSPPLGWRPTRRAVSGGQAPFVLEAVVLLPLEVILVRVDLSVHLHLDEVRRFPAHGSHLQRKGCTAKPTVRAMLAEACDRCQELCEGATAARSVWARRLPGVLGRVYADSDEPDGIR